MNDERHLEQKAALESLLPPLPANSVELDAVRARGKRLRRQRRAITAGAALASAAVILGGAFAALGQPTEPAPAGPGSGTTSAAQTDTGQEQSAPASDESSPPEPSGSSAAASSDSDRAAVLDPAAVESLASDSGLHIDRMDHLAPGVLDFALVDGDGIAYVATVVRTNSATDGQSQLDALIADRGYESIMVAGAQAFRCDPAVAGDSTDYAVLSDDGLTVVSISIVPPGTEAAGNQITPSALAFTQDELLPLLISL